MIARRFLARTVAMLCLVGGAVQGCGDLAEDAAPGESMPENVDCEGRGQPFVTGESRPSEDGVVSVQLLEAEPAPPAQAENFWTLELSDENEQPVTGASIVAVPYMIDHGHGAAAQIAADLGAGRYELGPLTLTMPGLWEITLQLTMPDGSETSVVYDVCVSAS
jgi:hypothetical protein